MSQSELMLQYNNMINTLILLQILDHLVKNEGHEFKFDGRQGGRTRSTVSIVALQPP